MVLDVDLRPDSLNRRAGKLRRRLVVRFSCGDLGPGSQNSRAYPLAIPKGLFLQGHLVRQPLGEASTQTIARYGLLIRSATSLSVPTARGFRGIHDQQEAGDTSGDSTQLLS